MTWRPIRRPWGLVGSFVALQNLTVATGWCRKAAVSSSVRRSMTGLPLMRRCHRKLEWQVTMDRSKIHSLVDTH